MPPIIAKIIPPTRTTLCPIPPGDAIVGVGVGGIGVAVGGTTVGVIKASIWQSSWSEVAAANPPHALTATTSHLYVLPCVIAKRILVVEADCDSLFLSIVPDSTSVTVTLNDAASA